MPSDHELAPPIKLPFDQYGHRDSQGDAPNEWWWHIGTLKSADGRLFGFEVNVTGQTKGKVSYAFAQLCITDVAKQIHYQKVNLVAPRATNWAEYDTTKPWYVRLPGVEGSTDGAVFMQALDHNPLHMRVLASFVDATTGVACKIELLLPQQGPPLLVWGDGCKTGVDPNAKAPLSRNNYYYSLTHLQATGTLTIGQEVIPVTGLTWMDHEYGAFPTGSPTSPNTWLLQDIQLANGVHLSNYSDFGVKPVLNKPMHAQATILRPNHPSYLIDTVLTPLEPVIVSAKKVTYYLRFKLDIKDPQHRLSGTFFVNSLCPDQVFVDPVGADVYEGVAHCVAHLDGVPHQVEGTAWIEESLG